MHRKSRSAIISYLCFASLALFALSLLHGEPLAGQISEATNQFITVRTLPLRVHGFEDFETDIERRWWLRGAIETNNLPPSLTANLANTRACRATRTKDFDDKMADPTKDTKAVVFNPVPGPPMGEHPCLSFR